VAQVAQEELVQLMLDGVNHTNDEDRDELIAFSMQDDDYKEFVQLKKVEEAMVRLRSRFERAAENAGAVLHDYQRYGGEGQ